MRQQLQRAYRASFDPVNCRSVLSEARPFERVAIRLARPLWLGNPPWACCCTSDVCAGCIVDTRFGRSV